MSSKSGIQSCPNGLSRSGWIMLVSLLLIAVAYRLFASHYDFLGNTAPLMAIAFGGALLMGGRFWFVPVLLLVISDFILGFWHGEGGIGGYTLMSITVYLIVGYIGGRARKSEKIWPMMWVGTLSCSIMFYVFANTYSWMMWPGYEKSFTGWWQSQTTGVLGINPPAWMFLRNALIADSIWCALAGLLFFAEKRFCKASEALVAKSA